MNKILLFLVALVLFVALAQARPIMFIASQTDGIFSITNGWVGVSYAYVTIGKGQDLNRIRIFGLSNINETYTGAWINYANGTIIAQIAFGLTTSERYYLGDLRLNDTIFTAFLNNEIYLTVASASHTKGSISGYFQCKPHIGFAHLNSLQFNNSGGISTTKNYGYGYAQIYVGVQTTGLPNDILAQDEDIASTSVFQGSIVYNGSFTGASFNGPANASETASALATGTIHNTSFSINYASWSNVTINSDFYSIDTGDTYYELNSTSGDIRGQVYPLVSPTRRAIPFAINTVDGNTTLPTGGFATLRYANQEGTEKNFNSFARFEAVSDGTNFTYLSVVSFQRSTNKKNNNIMRALTLEMNLRIIGTGTWFFEFYDPTLQEFIPAGTISSASVWTPAYIDNYQVAVSEYPNNRGVINVRVSTSSDVATTLWVDLMGLRGWIPSSNSNKYFKDLVKVDLALPAKYANGTEINVSS